MGKDGKHYLNESHERYTKACLKAVKKMPSLTRKQMEAQCKRIAAASAASTNTDF